jgi:hypothetical protein
MLTWAELISAVQADWPAPGDPYILFKADVPVAAALAPSMNPGFPEEILVGNKTGVIRKAERLLNYPLPIPLYIKHDTNKWEYMGMYGRPQKITNMAIYNNNLQTGLLLNPGEFVQFAIHWERISD